MERHHTTHNREHTGHSNPHDHEIDWSNGFPHLGEPINYNIYPVPEFKCFERIKFMDIQGNTDELRFESINDFKFALIYGREIEFEWNGVNYGAFYEGEDDKAFFLCEAHKDDKGVFFHTADELLDFVIDGKPLRKFITEVTVWNRNI